VTEPETANAAGMPAALVFDLDGLLIDTEEGCWEAARVVVGRHAAPDAEQLTEEAYGFCVGRSLEESWTYLRDRYGMEPEVAALVAERDDEMRSWYRAPVLMPGAAELVARARAAGVPVAIGTSAPSALVAVALDGMNMREAFDEVVAVDHVLVEAAKPAPDIYLAACRLLGVAPGEAAAMEDSPLGAQAAVAAGIPTYVVPNRWTRGREFPGAAHVRESLHDVLAELFGATGRSPHS
jgi:putative hydrolase of the HAD superfamily